jgi:hypothetical protein
VFRIATWARTVAAYAPATTGGWASCGLRRLAWIVAALAEAWWQWARLSAAVICAADS